MPRHEKHFIEPFKYVQDLSDEPVEYRIPDLLTLRGHVLLSAYQKIGKTSLVLDLITAMVTPRPFLGGLPCKQIKGNVMYVSFELQDNMLRQYCTEIGMPVPNERVLIQDMRGKHSSFQLYDEEWRQKYADYLYKNAVNVVVVDPIHPLMVANESDSNSNDEAREALELLSEIADDAELHHLIVVDHTGHSDKERARGASGKGDWADVIWNVTEPQKDESGRTLRATGRGASGVVTFHMDHGAFQIGGPNSVTSSSPKNRVSTELSKAAKPVSVMVIATAIGLDRSTTSRMLNELQDEGNARRTSKEGHAELWISTRGM